MANALTSALGLAAATYMGRESRKEDHAKRNKLLAAYKLPQEELKPAPIDKAIDWIGSKFKGDKAAPGVPDLASAPTSMPADSGDVGLWDRLKAGNIDAPGSEAYNRWGQGKADGDAAELTREMRRGDAPDNTVADFEESSRLTAEEQITPEKWESLPSMDDVSTANFNAVEELPLQ